MNQLNPWQTGHPTKNGVYFVTSPSPEPNQPLFFSAIWAASQWLGLPEEVSGKITHWMRIPPVPGKVLQLANARN